MTAPIELSTLRDLNRKLTEDNNADNGFAQFGGYMDAKISKLDHQFASSTTGIVQQSKLFEGISIFVNGLTNPSADELKRIMMVHGGIYHHYERSSTKFIIASNLPDVKIRNHSASKIIIRPEFITDSLKYSRVVDYKPYLLVTNANTNQPRIRFNTTLSDVAMKKVENISEEEKDLFASLNNLNQQLIKNNISVDQKPSFSKNQARTANDPKFLSEFYNNSRLHHISTLGAEFKQYISNLRENSDGNFPARDSLKELLEVDNKRTKNKSYVMHIDMDCFFVSVGLRKRPDLVGQPVAVTHSKGNTVQDRPGVNLQYELKVHQQRLDDKFTDTNQKSFFADLDKHNSLSEIASCSYEAREKGLKNGMFVGQAMKLCPNLKTIPYDFEGYKEVAYTLYNTIAKYTLDIEAVSCDEMYVDLSQLINDVGIVNPMDFITLIRGEIKEITQCPCSAGVGGNRIQARMATKKAKPNGQFYLSPEEVQQFFKDIPITDLPGVGRSTSHTLAKFNWKTCEDLQKISVGILQNEFGKKTGQNLHDLAHGIDDKPLNFGQIRKSVSAEVNYGIRFTEHKELETFLDQLCHEVHHRLSEIKKRAKCVTLKYMVRAKDAPVETAKFMGHGICDVVNKSHTITDYFSDFETIFKTVLNLNKSLNIPPCELRGIGIQITKLEEKVADPKPSKLLEMFGKVEEKLRKTEKVEKIQPPTPEKPITIPSPKSKVKSSPKPGRGRPRKFSKVVKNKNITEMIKSAAKPLDFEIDQQVLNELPEELRNEAVRSHKILMKRYNSETKIETDQLVKERQPKIDVDNEFLAALPPEIRKEVEEQMGIKNQDIPPKSPENPSEIPPPEEEEKNEDNIFNQNNWRQLLIDWIESSDCPEQTDVEIIEQNSVELVKKRRIDEVYRHFRFLKRILTENSVSCHWHEAYNKIVVAVQSEMIAEYGNKLAIDAIVCNKC